LLSSHMGYCGELTLFFKFFLFILTPVQMLTFMLIYLNLQWNKIKCLFVRRHFITLYYLPFKWIFQ
jgi:hypothetical protein